MPTFQHAIATSANQISYEHVCCLLLSTHFFLLLELSNVIFSGAGITFGTLSMADFEAQPSNSYIIIPHSQWWTIYCCSSNYSSAIRFTLSNNISTSYFQTSRLLIKSYDVSGCLQLYSNYSIQHIGVYTCDIDYSQGIRHSINIGIYKQDYSGKNVAT